MLETNIDMLFALISLIRRSWGIEAGLNPLLLALKARFVHVKPEVNSLF